MDPYRGSAQHTEAEAPRDRGIVGDVIDQFADPFAFYRELVQNAIDAGTPSVEVTVVHDAASQVVRATVRDQGEGMTREILENQLLVLFRSTKEKDDTKIGKFGIGFSSVLSPRPNVVVVTTVRDGRRLQLHLHTDLRYQVFDGGPAQRSGTAVELELPIAADQVALFARKSLEALVRWCRHAAVPITFTGPDGEPVRVDRPLGLDGAIVEVTGKADDGKTVAVVGVLAAATPYGGFFDRGLTLHETSEPLLGRVAFKVQDPRLGHTISRDNVRRDAAYDRAVAFVRELAARKLPGAAAAAVRQLADAGDRGAYNTLIDTLVEAGAMPDADAWVLPLIEPIGERRSVIASELGRRSYAATSSSPVTAALAAAGVAVVDRGLAAPLERRAGKTLIDAEAELTRVAPIAPSLPDQTLLDALGRLLDEAHRRPSEILLAELDGAYAKELAMTGGRDDAAIDPTDATWLVGFEQARRSPFERLRRPALVLNVRHASIVAARERADHDPMGAASLLARALLLRFELLTEDRSEALLAMALELPS